MASIRIGTRAQQQLLISATLRTQNRVMDAQTQVATGKKTQQFSGIASDASRLVTIKGELARTDQFQDNITISEKRLKLMNFSLEEIDNIARDFRSQLTTALNGDTADLLNLPTQAQGLLDQVVDMLNVRDDSRYLFAGGRTDTAPVDLANGTYTVPTAPPFDTTADTGYYEGDSVIQQTRIDEDFDLEYGITADEPALEKVVRSLDTIAQMTFSNPITAAEQQAVRDAVATLSEAIDDNGTDKTISALSAETALNLKMLDSVKEKHVRFSNFALTTIGDIENVNSAEAVAQLNFEQVQLETSYSLIARVQTMSLSKFLQ